MKRRVFKKVKLTQKESNLLLKIVLEERNRLLKMENIRTSQMIL